MIWDHVASSQIRIYTQFYKPWGMVNSYRRKHQTWHALCQKTPDVATCQIGNLKIIPGKLKISSGKINQRLPILDVSGTLENCRLLDQCIQFFSTLTLETIPGPLSIFFMPPILRPWWFVTGGRGMMFDYLCRCLTWFTCVYFPKDWNYPAKLFQVVYNIL